MQFFLVNVKTFKRFSIKGAGKGEGRCREVDLWPVIIRENIQPGPDCSERLMAYAKRCGGPIICFQNRDKLQGIVEKSWRVEKVEDFIDFQSKSRLELLEAATTFPCTCNGQWTQFAQKIPAQNGIQEADWCGAIFQALKDLLSVSPIAQGLWPRCCVCGSSCQKQFPAHGVGEGSHGVAG